MQDLETGIQKIKELKEWSDRIGSDEHSEIDEIVNLLNQAKNYQEEKDKRSMVWSVDDFIIQAENNWENTKKSFGDIYKDATCWQDVYDESKFQNALYEMIRKHDANYGITWDTIDFYLDEYCLKK